MPRDLVLALGQREPGEPAHVLARGAEVGIDAFVGHARPERGDACGAVGGVRLGPAPMRGRIGGSGEVGGLRQARVGPARRG